MSCGKRVLVTDTEPVGQLCHYEGPDAFPDPRDPQTSTAICSWNGWSSDPVQRCSREAHWSTDNGNVFCHQHAKMPRNLRVPITPLTASALAAIGRGEVKPWQLKEEKP